ncbi:MAG TPA: cyclic-phosphate processing receiver domain-containing protein [Myxococcaceae bacterium]|nr:cyclic-phosphate processing receiver domain-containing protein [Myxococcaceae bacterium]
MRLWIDDVRPMPAGFDVHARTAREALAHLRSGGVVHVSFDHDLGATSAKTGYDVAEWIEREAHAGRLRRLTWAIHSANPVGQKNIRAAMESADRAWSAAET